MKINKEKMKKLKASLANITLFLSIFVVLFPLSMPNVSAGGGDTIYVDITNDDPLRDGTEGNPFKYIQEAVTHAGLEHSGNVTIRVYEGTYPETITISSGLWSTLTLEGNGSDVTTIDALGAGTVISISASWVNVTGFT